MGHFPFSQSNFLSAGLPPYHLYRCAHLSLAKHGMTVVLVIYLALMLYTRQLGVPLGWQGPLHFMGFSSFAVGHCLAILLLLFGENETPAPAFAKY